jgi:hypothetical protein
MTIELITMQFLWKQAFRMPCINVRTAVIMKLEVACKQAADMIYITATFAAKELTLTPMNKVYYYHIS